DAASGGSSALSLSPPAAPDCARSSQSGWPTAPASAIRRVVPPSYYSSCGFWDGVRQAAVTAPAVAVGFHRTEHPSAWTSRRAVADRLFCLPASGLTHAPAEIF